MPDEVVKCSHDDLLRIEQLVTIVKALTFLGIEKVRITGGEPLVRRGVVSLIEQISPLVKTVSLTTNGTLLAPVASDLKKAGLRTVNVSIDTLDPILYKQITVNGNLSDAIAGIEKANELGFELKINSVLQSGINENALPSLLNFAVENNAVLRFIELMPFVSAGNYFEKHYIPASEIIKKFDLEFIEYENNCNYYDFEGKKVGFITPISNKFCYNCNRIRITAKGKCIPCLHCMKEFDLAPYINDEKTLIDALSKCIKAKPEQHNLSDGVVQTNMYNIGG